MFVSTFTCVHSSVNTCHGIIKLNIYKDKFICRNKVKKKLTQVLPLLACVYKCCLPALLDTVFVNRPIDCSFKVGSVSDR